MFDFDNWFDIINLEINLKGVCSMAKKSSDYFGLDYIVSLILAIIPFTAWLLGVITRFQEGKIIAGVIRIFGGWLIWILDLISMITKKSIFRLLNV